MSLLALDRTFAGRRVPPWLRRFEAEPEEALRDLLLGGADLGHLNPADPERVLLDWIESLGARIGLLAEVDRVLAAWIESSWGDPDPQGLGAAVAAVAWCRAADLISGCPGEEGLSGAAKALRERFLEEPSFLRSISEGRARDPEARAWLALAEHQSDRSLLSRWWSLCSLPPDVPWYHGDLGIYGLRRLPPETVGQAGGYPREVQEGLARLADALARRVEDGWLESETARKEFIATVRLTMAAYPFPQEKWLPYWRHVLQDRRLREPLAERWVRDLSPKLDQLSEKGPTGRVRWIQPDPEWKRRREGIEIGLGQGDSAAPELAQRLLDEQRLYARATGDSFFVVRSACNFAGRLRKANPQKALEWVRLALDLNPWHEFAWTIMAAVHLTLGNLSEAARAAREAVRRFPNDPVAHTGLAEVLKAQDRLADAEHAYRLATTRFPNDPVALNGLAEVLKAQERFTEAEATYRYMLEQFHSHQQAVYALHGLAGLLRRRGELDEAEKLLGKALAREPGNDVVRNTLKVFRAQREGAAIPFGTDEPSVEPFFKRPEEPSASEVPSEAISLSIPATEVKIPISDATPRRIVEHLRLDDLNVLITDTFLLRRWSRSLGRNSDVLAGELRAKAHAALESLVRLEFRSSLAAGEAGLLTLSDGNIEEGLALLQAATRRFPGSARVRYALARAERMAVSARALDPRDPEAPVRPWRRLARLETQLGPVALLGEARTWLGQTDGAVREEGARRSLGRLAFWIDEQLSRDSGSKRGAAEINTWWAREARKLAFGDRKDRSEEDLTSLSFYLGRVQTYSTELDLHEEDAVYRIAAA
ncbi:MAG: tetratricopeptide repeat protein [Acidobacteriota bacterium]